MSLRVITLVLAMALAGPVTGCSLVQEKTFGESLDEANTGTQIKTKLFASGGTSRFGEVDVEVADRLVLLSGRVPGEADRQEAEKIAWSIGAVDEVANELVITRRDLGRDFNDRWITEQVRARIIADQEIRGVNYNIQVFEGAVYMLGFGNSDDELRRAAEHAASVKGVAKVVSYVKTRGRNPQPTYMQTTAPPRPGEDDSQVDIAPPADQPAPIVAPDRQPTRRGEYSDPYAPGAAPPPGASGGGANTNSLGLESAPMPPVE
ncbi:MAG: BON domain-containing protein [Alphaproteobacteria bacterium]|nr:BON domain-containing protein [Alphaproteobacteria bacterium]